MIGIDGTYIPEEGTGEALRLHVLRLELGDLGCVKRDELALGRVVRVARDVGSILVDRRAGLGEVLVSDRTGSVLMRVPPVSTAREYQCSLTMEHLRHCTTCRGRRFSQTRYRRQVARG